MKSTERKFVSGIVTHCYQNTIDGGLLFYTTSDYLVFFTVFCTISKRYPVVILKLCLMPDHIHLSVVSDSQKSLSEFVRDYTSIFARSHNGLCERHGNLFTEAYGSALKIGDKAARTNFIYLDNNPVERKLCKKAEDYRWNFLAFAASPNPFSEKIVIRRCRKAMIRAIEEVKSFHSEGKPLTYPVLKRLFGNLERNERQQLTDYIISLYSVIDHDAVIRYFDSYEQMILAVHSNTGSEYDLNEVFTGRTDAVYYQMTSAIWKTGLFKDIHEVLRLPEEKRNEWVNFLKGQVPTASREQILKYLHLNPPRKRK